MGLAALLDDGSFAIHSAPPAIVRWRVVGFKEKVFQACQGAPIQPGGCCDRCSAGIRYVVTVKSTDGRVMDVGRDCAVTLEGGPELAEIRRAEREWEREQYLASPEYARIQAEERSRKAEREARAARAEEDHALMLHGMRTIIMSEASSEFERDRAIRYRDAILSGSTDTDPDDRDAARLGIAWVRAILPTSRHVGSVGDRIERLAMLEAFIPIETAYGRNYVQKFRSAEGEALVWFSAGGDLNAEHLGQWVRIKGTVKAHKEYQGQKETALSRCKITK